MGSSGVQEVGVAMSTSPALAASIAALSVVALILAALVLVRFRRGHQLFHLYWGVGLLLVFVSIAIEAVVYVGVWSQALVQTYFVITAVLVGILSLGSAELALRRRWKFVWFGYIGLTSVALVVVGFLYSVSPGVVVNGVISGVPSSTVVIVSTLVTVPAAALLIVTSAYGAIREKRYHLFYITAGTIVFSIAGALYVVAFPVSLYYADFVGVALLFLGFVRVPAILARMPATAASSQRA